MYATAAARSDGLLLLCGGRDSNGVPLGDAFGLARHRDGRWEWAAAPGSMPVGRYQHGAVFVGARLHISGGAVGGGRMVDDAASVAVLDTVRTLPATPNMQVAGCAGLPGEKRLRCLGQRIPKECGSKSIYMVLMCFRSRGLEVLFGHTGQAAGVWCTPVPAGPASEEVTRRCRHAVAAVGPYVFIFGGLRGSTLLDDFLLADDSSGTELSICDPRSSAWWALPCCLHLNAVPTP